MNALNIEKKIGTALRTALTDESRSARELVAAYATYAYGATVQSYDVLWTDGEWTIDSMPVDEWLEAMLSD
jgi:hypothetical protein